MTFQPGNQEAKKKGKNKKTIDREKALELFQQQILKEIVPVLRSALASAQGLTVMYQKKKVKNSKTGKYERTGEMVKVTSQDRVQELLNGNREGDDWYYITTKDPNIAAIKELFDRAFGKSKESIEVKHTGSKVFILDNIK